MIGIIRQDYVIIQGLPMNHTRFADWVTIWVVPKKSAELLHWTILCGVCIAAVAGHFYFLYARLKNGRIMLYPSASVRPLRPSVCKLFRFRVTPPTVYVRLSWNLVYVKAMRWFNAYYLEVMVQPFLAELQPFN